MNDQQMTTALELPGFRITQNHGAVRMTAPALLSLCLALISCATSTNEKPASLLEAQGTPPQSSAECLAQNLQPGDPFPASAIPESALSKRQSGWVAIRYDVLAGAAQNLAVVASTPAGLYDAAAMQHAARYRDPKGSTVRGCVITIEVKF